MNQSNTLRQLENILDEAIKNGDPKQISAPILLAAMRLDIKPQNIMDFYELLNKSEAEARKLINIPKIDRYIKVIEDLQVLFANNNVWSTPWSNFLPQIESANILNTLDALANYLHAQNPQLLVEEEFLEQLHSELDSLIKETSASNLSKEVKLFLIERLEELIKAIRRYIIDGTEGLSKAAKSLVVDFALTEKRLKDEDKQEPIFHKIKSWGLTLVLAFATPSPWDIVGAVPDITEFWYPKLHEIVTGREKIEAMILKNSSIQEILENSSNLFYSKEMKRISGKDDVKALPAAKESTESLSE